MENNENRLRKLKTAVNIVSIVVNIIYIVVLAKWIQIRKSRAEED